MLALIASILAQAEESAEEVSEAKDLYPAVGELIVGLFAFAVLFFFTWKWVLPSFKTGARGAPGEDPGRDGARRGHPQGGRQAPGGVPDAARRRPGRGEPIIEEARATADQLRRDLQAKAEEEAQAIVARAQEEIRAERDRVFQELRAQVGSIAVEIAERVVGQSLDEKAHQRLIDEFIDEVASGARPTATARAAKGSGTG